MKNNFYKLFTFIFAAGSLNVSAQLNCGTTEATRKLFLAHPELAASVDDHNTVLSEMIRNKTPEQRGSTTVYIIPIVFHIIHQNGAENISDAQIIDEVNILNRDFRYLNFSDTAAIVAPFKPIAADCYIEFRLAQIDPNGNCTNGIDRIYSHKTNSADDDSKLNQWPRNKYLNVWVVKTIGSVGVAGYAYYPAATAGPLFPYDGVLILSDYIGSIGTGSAFTSRALTHEIGHYLNLQHPWGNNNDPGVACGDDLVSDTPPTKGHTSCNSTDLYAPYCTTNTINANYKFDSLTTISGTTDPTPATAISGSTLSSMTANGVGANSTVAAEFSYDNWGTGAPDAATTYASMTGAINTGKYYEFTISPASNAYSMTLTGLTLVMNRNATGPRTWAIRSSASAYATNLTASISPANTNLSIQGSNIFFINSDITGTQKGTKVTLSGAAYTNRTSPVTFRIYAFNAEDAMGTFGIDSVYLSGTNGLIENTQNYMDYSYCSKMYTQDQRDRMRAALESPIAGRNNLWSASNLAATGVSSPAVCTPYPDFFANKLRVCAGDIVKFTKNVQYGKETGRVWTFEGGSPATDTSAVVNVTYSTPGTYKVTLTATNSAGTDSVVKQDYIDVTPAWADFPYNGSVTEDFENTANYSIYWHVNNYDNNANTWNIYTTGGYLSSKSVVMAAYGNYRYDVDDLLSPSYDLSFTSGNVLTFRCAAASHAGAGVDVNDVLKVYVSTNCGQTWSLRGTFKDSTLINNGYSAGAFYPTGSTVWDLRTVPIPSILSTSNVRFKFEYTSGSESNNIYIDNINLSGVVGVNENADATSSISIYPNPSNQSSTIAYHLNKKADTKIEVVDVLGKTILVQSNSGQAEGDYSLIVSKQNLNLKNGIYFVRLSIGNESVTRKLIITE
jgi:PKD repeat protein